MKNKYISFIKNAGIAAATGLAVGAGSAELSNLVTDNKTAVAITSAIGEYAAAYSVFLSLHSQDNEDIYRTYEGKFKWRDFIKDQVKLAGGVLFLDIAYLVGKPILTKKFLDSGINPSCASLYADAISYPLLIMAALPIAKITGNIKSKELRLEEKVK
jgi:hypothetical protein